MLRLEAVKFNHDPRAHDRDALSIRRNAATWVGTPEWRRGRTATHADSPAAYARDMVAGNAVTIQASFSYDDVDVTSVEVRAVGGGSGAAGRGVMGTVKPRVVDLANGRSGYVSFELQGHRLGKAPVGVHDVSWRWQQRIPPARRWQDLVVTHHRIYVVLGTPTSPWNQAPYHRINRHLPWTELLEAACAWAADAATPDEAAVLLTERLFTLGGAVWIYDCPGGGLPNYSWVDFDCTAFLDRLAGGVGNGVYVNCSDCATIVSTMANVLGADLWQSRMGWNFGLNPILAIGSSLWQPACGWPGFMFHEVAWSGACTAEDNVFDACLAVDGGSDPTDGTHVILLPANLPFGDSGDLQYRDRLVAPASRASCDPQPGTRRRRSLV